MKSIFVIMYTKGEITRDAPFDFQGRVKVCSCSLVEGDFYLKKKEIESDFLNHLRGFTEVGMKLTPPSGVPLN